MKIKQYLLITAALLTVSSYSYSTDSYGLRDISSLDEEDDSDRIAEELQRKIEQLKKDKSARIAATKKEILKAREVNQKNIEANEKKETALAQELEDFKKRAADKNVNKEQLKKEFTTLMAKLKKTANASGHIVGNYKDLGNFWDQRTKELLTAYNKATERYVSEVDGLLKVDNHNTQRDFLNKKKSMKKSRKNK
jgi:hypothetical protein